MSNGRGDDGGSPPSDDRTLLDPLSNEELKALREARQRSQQKKPGGGAVASRMTFQEGEAKPSSRPSLPSFEGGAKVAMGSSEGVDGEGPTLTPGQIDPLKSPAGRGPTTGETPQQGAEPPKPGQPGFGENTLLWMAPPKVTAPTSEPTSTGFVVPPSPQDKAARNFKMLALAAFVLVVGIAIFVTVMEPPSGTVMLHTDPPRAALIIDGTKTDNPTPVKLLLPEGPHELELSLEGFETERVTIEVKAEKTERTDVVLSPISQPGLKTVTLVVKPLSADITIDGTTHPGKTTLKVPNLDPKVAHQITVEAMGYIKVDQRIAPGELQDNYSFTLQQDDSDQP